MLCLKRFITLLFITVCLIAGLFLIFNIPVTSKQGINYVVKPIKMPLYIKIIEFLNRDYHYRELVKIVCQGCSSEEDMVLTLFEWTHQNIKRDIPEDWPIVDDHVWNIIVRGYGASDQLADVFATLCNYAGIDAFFTCVYAQDGVGRIPLSFVKIKEKWTIFDPYHGVYFKDEFGRIADIKTIRVNKLLVIEKLDQETPSINYTVYFNNLPHIEKMKLRRSNIQSPLRRTIFEVKKWLKVR